MKHEFYDGFFTSRWFAGFPCKTRFAQTLHQARLRACKKSYKILSFHGRCYFIVYLHTLKGISGNCVLFTIFVLIDFLFIGLTLTSFGIMEHATHMLAAYSELAIAIVSFYGCGAAVLNTHFGRVFLPVGKPFGIFKK